MDILGFLSLMAHFITKFDRIVVLVSTQTFELADNSGTSKPITLAHE